MRLRFGIAAAVVVLTFALGVSGLAASADAAFPGRNGLLAVQPLKGQDTVLIAPDGRGRRLVCVYGLPGLPCGGVDRYGYENRPRWSPDGRALLLNAEWTPGRAAVVYPDGSCLDCYLTDMSGAAFTANPTLFTSVSGPLVEWGIDGLARKELLSAGPPVSDPVWSSRGELAVVRGGGIWVGKPGKLRRITAGSDPSWSPDGRQIAFARQGWVRIGLVRGRSFRRLVRGTAPAWSPDGRWIAFFGGSQRLNVVPVGGGRVRHVGAVTGWNVDWQPIPKKRPAACLTPPDSTVTASSDTGSVAVASVQEPPVAHPFPPFSSTPSWSAMGCLRADGRERLLASGGPNLTGSDSVSKTAVAGNYAALVIKDYGYNRYTQRFGSDSRVDLFDLRTACSLSTAPGFCLESPERGGEYTSCTDPPGTNSGTSCDIDQLALGSDAVSAVHTTSVNNGCACTVEQIQASDGSYPQRGAQTLDSVTEPNGSPTALTNLRLTGDSLTWQHNSSPRSAQLQP